MITSKIEIQTFACCEYIVKSQFHFCFRDHQHFHPHIKSSCINMQTNDTKSVQINKKFRIITMNEKNCINESNHLVYASKSIQNESFLCWCFGSISRLLFFPIAYTLLYSISYTFLFKRHRLSGFFHNHYRYVFIYCCILFHFNDTT